ncbi:MAG: sulfite exporter TauE/SafE family protein [Planctomycetota bacterium]|nr:sulfite exporter TauE/SafE family protein [Planctomycetota bacterium]
MELHVIVWLVAAGLALGFINNLAGAAGVIGLVALEGLTGMSTMEANASLRLSAVAVALAGMVGFSTKGQKIPRKMWGYSLLTIPGAVGGALMVHSDFELLFRVIVMAILTVILIQQLRNRGQNGAPINPQKSTPWWLLVILFSWLGAHMGFLQIAAGLVAIFILSIVHSRDLVQINAAKMAVVLTAAVAGSITLACTDRITWAPALTMAAGAALGSFSASRWSVSKGHGAVRVVVVMICVAVLVRIGYQLIAD